MARERYRVYSVGTELPRIKLCFLPLPHLLELYRRYKYPTLCLGKWPIEKLISSPLSPVNIGFALVSLVPISILHTECP